MSLLWHGYRRVECSTWMQSVACYAFGPRRAVHLDILSERYRPVRYLPILASVRYWIFPFMWIPTLTSPLEGNEGSITSHSVTVWGLLLLYGKYSPLGPSYDLSFNGLTPSGETTNPARYRCIHPSAVHPFR